MNAIRSRRFPVKRIFLSAAAAMAVLVAALSIWAAIYAKPLLKARAVTVLATKFHADVQMGDFDVSIFPRIRIHGRNLSLRQEGRTDVPPLIQVDEFLAVGGLGAFIGKPWKLDRVNLTGLKITIPPLQRRKPQKRLSPVRDIPIFVHQISANNGLVEILSQHGASHLFIVRDLDLHSVGLHQAAAFSTELINPTPLGFVHAAGSFGPWDSEEPGLTPLLSHYTLTDANLSAIKGIGGILSSQGQFEGVLNQMEVTGETDTPDFRVTLGGHPVSLHTTFSATKVQTLSRKGLGMPKNEAAGSDVSNLQGRFQLDNGLMTFRDLHFEVERAEVQVEGTYDLTHETLNFHGDLRLNAKLSQTMAGFKSILLKPFDGFFRKNGMTEIPIRITGTRSSPLFGSDFHHKN